MVVLLPLLLLCKRLLLRVTMKRLPLAPIDA